MYAKMDGPSSWKNAHKMTRSIRRSEASIFSSHPYLCCSFVGVCLLTEPDFMSKIYRSTGAIILSIHCSPSTTTSNRNPLLDELMTPDDTEESICSGEEGECLLPPPSSWFRKTEEYPEQPKVVVDGAQRPHTNQKTETTLPMRTIEEPDSPTRPTTPPEAAKSAALIASPRQAPSWSEIPTQVLPAAANELLQNSLHHIIYTARLSYSKGRWTRKYSEIHNKVGGYHREHLQNAGKVPLPAFSTLNWVDRQLVQEWRTISTSPSGMTDEDQDEDFDNARTLVPPPHEPPIWQKADLCFACRQPFGPTLLRHHCRMCGRSYCQPHSSHSHLLPQLGYEVPERVCCPCKDHLQEQALAERVAWRLARCRDLESGDLTPYFETGVDTVEDAALRITQAAIALTRKIPLGAQAHVAVETIEVLRKHGLKGIYGLILRKEFLAAADLLCKALGINKTRWPLSAHELSAAIFYALAQHRAIRGMHPERERMIHTIRKRVDEPPQDDEWGPFCSAWTNECLGEDEVSGRTDTNSVIDQTDTYNPTAQGVAGMIALVDSGIQKEMDAQEEVSEEDLPFSPVCDEVPDAVLASLLFYAPISLNFIYAEREVDMQLLAAQQGWRLLYSHLEQQAGSDQPASALFCHEQQKIACLAIRGTATVNDVVTDIRQMPVPFPDEGDEGYENDDWTPVFSGQGLAVCGMATAAVNLYREHMDVLLWLAKKGYRIRITGHSLGGGVATLLGALVLRHLERSTNIGDTLGSPLSSTIQGEKQFAIRSDLLRVYGYGTPACVDARLSDYAKSFVTTVVLHDDVIPRLTPTSIRGLLKHLLHIRETWVKVHLNEDLMAITERAKSAWAPRWRQSFTLSDTSFKYYYRKQIQYGKRKYMSIKGKLSRRMKKVDEDEDDHSHNGNNKDGDSLMINDAQSDDTKDWQGEDDTTASSEQAVNLATPERGPILIMDMMGGIDGRMEGMIVDGDEFYDAEESLVESYDDDSAIVVEDEADNVRSLQDDESFDSDSDPKLVEPATHYDGWSKPHRDESITQDDSWADFDDRSAFPPAMNQSEISSLGSVAAVEGLEEDDEPSSAVILEETPLPRMFLPGNIVHIYTYRGGYKAAFVPKAFRELRRISLAGNMLSDHSCKAYYEALLEVKSIRHAQEGLPRWTAFDEDDTCSCCASKFTWASTSDSEAQEARDKHNCRSCGTLVCDPCSKNRIPLPSVGITIPNRVCDRCYNDIGGILTGSGMTCSFLVEESVLDEPIIMKQSIKKGEDCQPERQRERRSLVVDDLASRIHSTVTCS